MIKISPSILGADFADLKSEVQKTELANADYIAAILEKCIPELANGTVNIEKIARMA